MKNAIGLAILLCLTSCACQRDAKKVAVLRKSLKETRVRNDYAVDQNLRYSKQVKKLIQEKRKTK